MAGALVRRATGSRMARCAADQHCVPWPPDVLPASGRGGSGE